ncbi:MAG: STAS domain-containing protein [Myxococcota bacterium]
MQHIDLAPIRAQYIDTTPILALPSLLDESNTSHLISAVRREIAAGRRVMVLDFAATRAIDATALAAIIYLYKSLRIGEGDLCFINVGEAVARLLAITQLDQVFRVVDSLDEIRPTPTGPSALPTPPAMVAHMPLELARAA